jgi:hypothetical protein
MLCKIMFPESNRVLPGYSGAHEKAKLSSPKHEPQLIRSSTPSNSGRLSLGSARDSTSSINLASEIYKVDAANQIELSKILWEVRFLQNPEEMERQLQVIDGAMLAQVHAMQLWLTHFHFCPWSNKSMCLIIFFADSVENWPNCLLTETGLMTK